MKLYDISPFLLQAEVFDGDPIPELKQVKSIKNSDEYNLTELNVCSHNGSHIDAPLHFCEDGKSITELSLEKFYGPCVVAEASEPITARWVSENLPWNCTRLIVKFTSPDCFITQSAVNEINRFHIELVGVNSLSVAFGEQTAEIHRELFLHDIALLEGLVLDEVPVGDYTLCAFPLKVDGAEASVCRAVLIKSKSESEVEIKDFDI